MVLDYSMKNTLLSELATVIDGESRTPEPLNLSEVNKEAVALIEAPIFIIMRRSCYTYVRGQT